MSDNLEAKIYGCFGVETGADYVLTRMAKTEEEMRKLDKIYKDGGIYTQILLVVSAGYNDNEGLTPSCISRIILNNNSNKEKKKYVHNRIDELVYAHILKENFGNIYKDIKGRTISLDESAFDYLQLIEDWGITLEHILDFKYSLNNQ